MLANILRKNLIPTFATGANLGFTALKSGLTSMASVPAMGKVAIGGVTLGACQLLPCQTVANQILDTSLDAGATVIQKTSGKLIESTITGIVQGVARGTIKSTQVAYTLFPTMEEVFNYFGPPEGETYQDITQKTYQKILPIAEGGIKIVGEVGQAALQGINEHPYIVASAVGITVFSAVVYNRQAILAKMTKLAQMSCLPTTTSQSICNS